MEASKIQGELQSEVEGLRRELELIKDDEFGKEAQLAELRRQCNELVKSRCIEVSVLMNKPKDSVLENSSGGLQPGKTGKAAPVSKTSKNLQMAKELNREMELMFAEDDDRDQRKPIRKTKKKDKRQQVHFGNV